MKELNNLVELAKGLRGESWKYTHTSKFSNGYITGKDGRTIVETYGGDVPANACRFIQMANPATILAIAEAFRALEQRAEAAEARIAVVMNEKNRSLLSESAMHKELKTQYEYAEKSSSRISELEAELAALRGKR